MSRAIKFRAWDGKAMIVFPAFSEWTCSEDAATFYWEGIGQTLMQFTGLLDAKGKEIYEGDIVLVPDEEVVPVTDYGEGPLESCNHIVSVVFRDGEFGFEIPEADDGYTGWYTFKTWDDIGDTVEIIGNIYENPDLLDV